MEILLTKRNSVPYSGRRGFLNRVRGFQFCVRYSPVVDASKMAGERIMEGITFGRRFLKNLGVTTCIMSGILCLVVVVAVLDRLISRYPILAVPIVAVIAAVLISLFATILEE